MSEEGNDSGGVSTGTSHTHIKGTHSTSKYSAIMPSFDHFIIPGPTYSFSMSYLPGFPNPNRNVSIAIHGPLPSLTSSLLLGITQPSE